MRRYSISIHKDTNLMESTKRYLEQCRQTSMISYEKGIINLPHTTSLNWNTVVSLVTDGKRGLAFQIINNSARTNFPGPARYFLVLLDHREHYQIDYVFLLPDDIKSPHSFTGFIVPNTCMAYNFMLPLASTPKGLQHGSKVISTITSMENDNIPEPKEEEPDKSFTLVGGHNTIADIVDYLKCYDNNPSSDHTYEVMLCVSQPIPGSRDPWGLSKKEHEETGNPVCVGHTFLVLTEKTPNKIITRNLGFYPNGYVWPYEPTRQGELVNNSYHDYNICIVISVRSHEFAAILKFVKQGNDKGFMYDLNSNNCTTFALNALAIANIQLPRTVGYWKGGSGCNPGDLGEDLRKFTLTKNMQRFTVYQAHGNKGNCIM